MSTIEKSIEVNVPEYTAYAQWTDQPGVFVPPTMLVLSSQAG
jgi:hypothetical protein